MPIVNIWWRRAVAYILRIILPASLLSQLVGSVFCGRSSPGGAIGFWIDCSSAVVVRVISSWSTRNGRSWAHRLLRIQVLDQDSNLSISGMRMGIREVAHLADFVSPFIGFLWPLWDDGGRTFADKIVRTIVIAEK
ncbi:RDD family protein [Bifidobacterium dentium]|uniref:RDD family protein n=1 Tax=Bifidobacterium dentium TaxID=1689 RepID=UPI00321945CF